jgi:hypothetical protein
MWIRHEDTLRSSSNREGMAKDSALLVTYFRNFTC